MKQTLRLDPHREPDLRTAADLLRGGGCVAFPTETVYGLGVDATSQAAVKRAFVAKGRPADNPLIVHLHCRNQLELYCHSVPAIAYSLMERFCPGALTLVLPKRSSIVDAVTAGLETVAVRFPAHATARAILQMADVPVAAPSANRSGRPSGTTWQSVLEDLDGRIDAVVCDAPCHIGIESTVVDVTGAEPVVLRCGSVSIQQLLEVCKDLRTLGQVIDPTVNSPGLRHRHYQPTGRVVLVSDLLDLQCQLSSAESSLGWGFIGLEALPGLNLGAGNCKASICENVDHYARQIFSFFRECDSLGIGTIYCQCVPDHGIGQALMDRLKRAASES